MMPSRYSARVAYSNHERYSIAATALSPHISMLGRRLPQTGGRSDRPNRRQRLSGVSCTQRTPAGLPSAMPGITDEIEGAIQQAAHPIRQSIASELILLIEVTQILRHNHCCSNNGLILLWNINSLLPIAFETYNARI